jgi:hypothetical protein
MGRREGVVQVQSCRLVIGGPGEEQGGVHDPADLICRDVEDPLTIDVAGPELETDDPVRLVTSKEVMQRISLHVHVCDDQLKLS